MYAALHSKLRLALDLQLHTSLEMVIFVHLCFDLVYFGTLFKFQYISDANII